MPELQRLLSFGSAVAVIPAALVIALAVFHLAGAGALDSLRYDRDAVLAGEVWRLVTGHLVHSDAIHLGWNLLGVVIVGFLFAADYSPREWLVILLVSTAATDLGFLLLEPQLEWYVGFSGVLHGLMAAGLVACLRLRHDVRPPESRCRRRLEWHLDHREQTLGLPQGQLTMRRAPRGALRPSGI